MRTLFLILFSPVFCVAQFNDDFNDGDFNSPLWFGDTSLFAVNLGVLQLDDIAGGSAALMYSRPFTSGLTNHEWSFKLQLDFSPSSQNYARYFLCSNTPDPRNATDAVYIQFGEAGSNDAPELFLMQSGITQSLGRGITGSVATSFTQIFTLRCDSFYNWTLFNGVGAANPEFSAQHVITISGSYAGWLCNYTAGNANDFYLDDVYDGAIRYDTLPPALLQCISVSDDTVNLIFNEKLNISQAVFTINNDTVPGLLRPDSQTVKLLVPVLISGQTYHISVLNPMDIAGNSNPLLTCSFNYIVASDPLPGQLIITEIMADPDDASQLPEAEYVEIFNRSHNYLLTHDLLISDGSSEAELLSDTIAPDTYRVFATAANAQLLNADGINAEGLTGFPSLNNDGDRITLKKSDGQILDEVNYTTEMYHDQFKSEGGWSLERIDLNYPCFSALNWSASANTTGGTPGVLNSVDGNYYDTETPCLLYAVMKDSLTIRIHFSEPVDSLSAMNLNNYSVENGLNFFNTVKYISDTEYELSLGISVIGLMTIIADVAITDCSQNSIGDCNRVVAGQAVSPQPGDLLINEVLFNPYPGGADFIELINNSGFQIALDSLYFVSEDELGGLEEAVAVQLKGRCIGPGEILAFSPDPDNISKTYPETVFRNLIKLPLPAMNDAGDRIRLQDRNFRVIDRLSFSDNWHYPLLSSTEGVSLERISTFTSSEFSSNWHSASSASGYATPGKVNSQTGKAPEGQNLLELGYELFSPDNDGDKDFLPLKVNTPQPGFIIRLAIYNQEGRQVRLLSENDLGGMENLYNWDGEDDNFVLQAPGIYLVLCEAVHPGGMAAKAKSAFVLARRF